MKGNFVTFVSRRYLFSRKAGVFQQIITIISITGIVLGVASLLVVMSVMNGLQRDLKDRILGINAHVVVLRYHNAFIPYNKAFIDSVKNLDNEIVSADPFIYTKVMIKKDNYVDGVVLRGYDSKLTTYIDSMIAYGRGVKDSVMPEVLVGVDIATQMHCHIGDTIYISSPFGSVSTPFGSVPKTIPVMVSGIFESGMYQYDSGLIYVSMNTAWKLIDEDSVMTGVELWLKEPYKAQKVAKKIEEKLGYPYRTNNWIELNSALFSALKMEKTVMFVILTLIILVAAFNIIITLVMLVMRKTREIGILRAMGSSKREIMYIFITDGVLIGIVGTVIGVILSVIISYLLSKYHYPIPGEAYLLDYLPVRMQIGDYILVSFLSVFTSFIATIYPAFSAANMDPVEAIRYE